jgi:hypothetical protein
MERDLQLTFGQDFQRCNSFFKLKTLSLDAPSLSLRASPAYGMHVHLARAKRDQAKLNAVDEFVTIAESGSTRCYFFKVHLIHSSILLNHLSSLDRNGRSLEDRLPRLQPH